MTDQIGINMIQGPHCIADFPMDPSYLQEIDTDTAISLVDELADTLGMKKRMTPGSSGERTTGYPSIRSFQPVTLSSTSAAGE